jgi:hypothetical protein
MSPTPKLMPECLDIQAAVLGPGQLFQSAFGIEAGTHLIVDALMCPYRIGERVRAKTAALSHTRDATHVGQRTAFLCNGTSDTLSRM